MVHFASLVGKALGLKPRPDKDAPAPLPHLPLNKKEGMIADLVDRGTEVVIAVDETGPDAVSMATSLSDVFARAGWRVTRRALAAGEAPGVTLVCPEPMTRGDTAFAIAEAWRKADLGPIQHTPGIPAAPPELRIVGSAVRRAD